MADKKINKRSTFRRREEAYKHRTNAICVTIYDPYGNIVDDDSATKILNSATEIAVDKGYVVNFTRL